MTIAESNYCKLPLIKTAEGDEDEEATASLAAANMISVDAAVAASLKNEKR